MRFIDLSGKRYGRLRVAWPVGVKGKPCGRKASDILWLCFCDCGKSKIVYRSALRDSLTKSCGCIRSETTIKRNYKHGQFSEGCGSSEIRMLYSAKRHAKKKGLPFNITLSDISIPDICPFLEIPIKAHKNHAERNSPSLDKIKPSLGYVKGNIRVLSFKANTMKSDSTLEEMKLLVKNWENLDQEARCDN